MNLSQIDLNLLGAFDALMAKRQVAPCGAPAWRQPTSDEQRSAPLAPDVW